MMRESQWSAQVSWHQCSTFSWGGINIYTIPRLSSLRSVLQEILQGQKVMHVKTDNKGGHVPARGAQGEITNEGQVARWSMRHLLQRSDWRDWKPL